MCRRISERASQHVREDIIGRGWSNRSINAISPLANRGEGWVGVRTSARYLMRQNEGFGPFVMYWVEGRKVPIKDSSGTHVVTGRGAGKPGWVTLPGGVKKWRDQKWRHPGLQPKNFMQKAISKAIEEEKGNIRDSLMSVLRGEYREGM